MDDVFEAGTNIVRFPSVRAGWSLMGRVCEMQPDVREVLSVADSQGLAMPGADLRDRVDEETARHIAEQVLPLAPSERRLALDVLLAPVVAGALGACEASSRASRRCVAALRETEQARQEGGHWMGPLEERTEVLALEAGRLLVAAHLRCQEAHGVARAVGLARRGRAVDARCRDGGDGMADRGRGRGTGGVTAGGAARLCRHAVGG